MGLPNNNTVIRLLSNHGKYLWASTDVRSVKQNKNPSFKNAEWTVEVIDDDVIRLKSCYGTYLSATDEDFLLGWTGCKVIQTNMDDFTVRWKIIWTGNEVMLTPIRGQGGQYLNANSSLPPWNNSVTHMVPGTLNDSSHSVWKLEVVRKIPEVHKVHQPSVLQDFTKSQSSSAQPSQVGQNVSNLLSGASSVASLGLTGYKIHKELNKEEPTLGASSVAGVSHPGESDGDFLSSLVDSVSSLFG